MIRLPLIFHSQIRLNRLCVQNYQKALLKLPTLIATGLEHFASDSHSPISMPHPVVIQIGV